MKTTSKKMKNGDDLKKDKNEDNLQKNECDLITTK